MNLGKNGFFTIASLLMVDYCPPEAGKLIKLEGQPMIRALGEAAYWVGFIGSAAAAAMGIWALMNFPIVNPENFVMVVGSKTALVFVIGLVVRKFARQMS